jgi:hypothetical protein
VQAADTAASSNQGGKASVEFWDPVNCCNEFIPTCCDRYEDTRNFVSFSAMNAFAMLLTEAPCLERIVLTAATAIIGIALFAHGGGCRIGASAGGTRRS